MFRVLITFLTTAMMLAHGLFGCCWHHEHGHVGEVAEKAPAIGTAEHHEIAAHQHSDRLCHDDAYHDGDSELPCPSECDSERCVFVRTSDGNPFDAGSATAVRGFTAVVPSFELVATPTLNRAPSWPAVSPIAAAPLHARLNVWLI